MSEPRHGEMLKPSEEYRFGPLVGRKEKEPDLSRNTLKEEATQEDVYREPSTPITYELETTMGTKYAFDLLLIAGIVYAEYGQIGGSLKKITTVYLVGGGSFQVHADVYVKLVDAWRKARRVP